MDSMTMVVNLFRLAVYITAFVWVFATPSASIESIDRIVAIVNDDIVTLSELRYLLEPYIAQIKARGYSPEQERKMLYKVRQDLLNQLIDEKLTDHEIQKANIQVSETEIDSMIERIKEARLLTDEELRQALEKEGIAFEEYRKRMKEQILRTKLVNREIKSKIVITKEDIKSFYDSHPELHGGEEAYHLRNIVMTVSNAGEKQPVYEKMEMILERLESGESFKDMAQRFSESSAARDGGDLGVFKMETLSPQIQAAIKDLNPGEFTPVLDTDQGYQILYIEERTRTPGKSLDEVSNEIREKLYNEIVNRKFELWLENLRKRSHIKIIK
jgi:peptidyl-prolyl cis-trans isomerase SurA